MLHVKESKKMTPEQFAYWLQGFFEMSETKKLNPKQVQMIKDHLQQVFTKQTPDYTQSDCIIATSDVCIDGNLHNYPSAWFGTVPPNCQKCGKQAELYDATITETVPANPWDKDKIPFVC